MQCVIGRLMEPKIKKLLSETAIDCVETLANKSSKQPPPPVAGTRTCKFAESMLLGVIPNCLCSDTYKELARDTFKGGPPPTMTFRPDAVGMAAAKPTPETKTKQDAKSNPAGKPQSSAAAASKPTESKQKADAKAASAAKPEPPASAVAAAPPAGSRARVPVYTLVERDQLQPGDFELSNAQKKAPEIEPHRRPKELVITVALPQMVHSVIAACSRNHRCCCHRNRSLKLSWTFRGSACCWSAAKSIIST